MKDKIKQIDVIEQQEIDLQNIKNKGYSDNLIIADDSDKGYTMTEFPDENLLGF